MWGNKKLQQQIEYLTNLIIALSRHLEIHPKELQKMGTDYENNLIYFALMAKGKNESKRKNTK